MTEVTAFQYFPWWSFEPTHLESQAKARTLSDFWSTEQGGWWRYSICKEGTYDTKIEERVLDVQVTNGRYRSLSLYRL